jgi:hypothetical protein
MKQSPIGKDMSRVIPTKRIIDIYLGAQSHYDNTEEHIQSLNHRIGYLEKQHYKVKNNLSNFTHELMPNDKELLSYIEAKLEATQKLRKKVIQDETLQETRSSTDDSEALTRQQIFSKAQEFKTNGMSVNNMFDAISDWLLEDLEFTKKEVKKRFNFSLEDAYSFNRLVTKNISFDN